MQQSVKPRSKNCSEKLFYYGNVTSDQRINSKYASKKCQCITSAVLHCCMAVGEEWMKQNLNSKVKGSTIHDCFSQRHLQYINEFTITMQMSMKLHLEEKAWLFEGLLKESEKQ